MYFIIVYVCLHDMYECIGGHLLYVGFRIKLVSCIRHWMWLETQCLFYSGASLKNHTQDSEDTDTQPSHIILTPCWPVLALPSVTKMEFLFTNFYFSWRLPLRKQCSLRQQREILWIWLILSIIILKIICQIGLQFKWVLDILKPTKMLQISNRIVVVVSKLSSGFDQWRAINVPKSKSKSDW